MSNGYILSEEGRRALARDAARYMEGLPDFESVVSSIPPHQQIDTHPGPDFLKLIDMSDAEKYRDLLLSHRELRAALIVAGKRIRQLNFGKRDDPALVILRRTLREARAVAVKFKKR